MDKSNLLNDSPFSAYLTETDLAIRWQVSKKLIQKHRYDGTGVPFLRIGRLVRYRREDVVAYEEACRRTSTSERGTWQ
ncbi:MAG: terminase [Rhodospirillaceae bacterium]|nr:MAG: terminase [Rhodospirillaceae bacterium]